MRIGLCADFSIMQAVEDAGFDYIEIPVRSYARLTVREVRAMRKKLDQARLSCIAGNFFYASDLRLTGDRIDTDGIRAYIRDAIARAEILGCRVLVVGCGPQRSAPAGFSKSLAVQQFGEHLAYAEPLARAAGITLTIENIWHGDTNILNRVKECYQLSRDIDLPNVRMMADFVHMRREKEPMTVLTDIKNELVHAHIANSYTAACPICEEEDEYQAFLQALKSISYSGALTVETVDPQNAGLSLLFLRTLTEKIGL